jgi:hypothetical protein
VSEYEVGDVKEIGRAKGMVKVKRMVKGMVKGKENGKVKGKWKGREEWRWESLKCKREGSKHRSPHLHCSHTAGAREAGTLSQRHHLHLVVLANERENVYVYEYGVDDGDGGCGEDCQRQLVNEKK